MVVGFGYGRQAGLKIMRDGMRYRSASHHDFGCTIGTALFYEKTEWQETSFRTLVFFTGKRCV